MCCNIESHYRIGDKPLLWRRDTFSPMSARDFGWRQVRVKRQTFMLNTTLSHLAQRGSRRTKATERESERCLPLAALGIKSWRF